MIKVDVQKNLIGIEDLLVGVGTVQQVRGPASSDPITITKINGSNMPYDAEFSMSEKFDALQLQIDTLPAVVDEGGNLLTGLINTSALDLNLTGRLWRKEIDADTAAIYYDDELLFEYDPIDGNIYIPGGTDYIAADAAITAAYTAADIALQADIDALDVSTNGVQGLETGTGANNLVQLDGSARLPAVDGSQLTNLNIPDGIPIGSIMAVPYSTPDSNWLECDGQEISRTTYATLFAKIGTTYGDGDGVDTFNIPDYRGEFLRGFDNGKGVDPGRAIGTFQDGAIEAHTHLENYVTRSGNGNLGNLSVGSDLRNATKQTGSTGDTETRPRNWSIMYQMKVL